MAKQSKRRGYPPRHEAYPAAHDARSGAAVMPGKRADAAMQQAVPPRRPDEPVYEQRKEAS